MEKIAATTRTTMAADNYKFDLIGTPQTPFLGYISSEDPTRVSPRAMVRGSQNVYLRNNGNIANRPGKKRYDPADATQASVVSSFDWEDMDGNTLLVRVLETGELQFYRTTDSTWYTLGTYTNTDFSFAKWWSQRSAKELLVMANNTTDLFAWSGGFISSVGDVNTSNSVEVDWAGPTTDVSFSYINIDGEISTKSNPDLNGGLSAIVLNENPPDDGQSFLGMSITQTAPFVSAQVFIQFVSVLSVPLQTTWGQVLVGSSKEETTANLLAFLQDPGNSSATHSAVVDADTVDSMNDLTYAIVDSLESGTTETFAEQGFIDDGSIIVNDISYTYDLVVDRWLVNISGTPATDTFAYAGIVTTDMTDQLGDTYLLTFLLCLNNQIIVCSYNNRTVYISSNQDTENSTGYNDFVNGGDLIPGDPDFAVLDEFPKGGTTKGPAAYIGAGTSSWYEVTPNVNVPVAFTNSSGNDSYIITQVKKFSGAGLTAPLGFNFVTTVGEDIIYTSQDNQLRTLGFYRNVFQQKSPSLSLAVRSELQSEDFTGGSLRAIDEFIYQIAPISGKVYLYQIRDDIDNMGNITSIRQWQPPMTWNITRTAIVDGIVHGFSNENPQLYQLWDTNIWHDETSVEGVFAPYICKMRLAYRQFDDRDDLGKFDKAYFEGYVLPNADLQALINYDYRGATFSEEMVLSSADINPVLFSDQGVSLIGDDDIGSVAIGGGDGDEEFGTPMPKFRVIKNVPIKDCFEYQIEIFSEALDSRWQIMATGVTAQESTQSPVWLQSQA